MTQLFEKPMEVVQGLRPSDVLQSIARTASSFAESASSFAESATTLANELVHVKTKDELAQGELQQEIALARQHRDLSVRAGQLALAVKQKRTELEESLLRIEEMEQAVAAREHILANPVVRRPPPDPLAESRRRAAAQQLYQAFAGEGVSAAREVDAYSESLASLADDDAAYDEDVYAYDDDAPVRAGSKAPTSEPTDADRALEGLRAMLPSPRTAAAAYAAAQPPAAAGPSRSGSQVLEEGVYGEAPQRTMTAGSLGPASTLGADSRTATLMSEQPARKPSGRRGSSVGSASSMPEPARAGSGAGADMAARAASSAAVLAGGAPPLPSGGGILGDMLGGDSRPASRAPTQEFVSRTQSGSGGATGGPAGTDPAAVPSKAASMGGPGVATSLQADVARRSATVATVGGAAKATRAPSADAAAMAMAGVGEEEEEEEEEGGEEEAGYEYYSGEEDAAAVEAAAAGGGGGGLAELYQQAHDEEEEEPAVAVPGAGLSVLVGGSESGDGGSVGSSLITPGGETPGGEAAGEEGYEYYSDDEGGGDDDASPEPSRAATALSGTGPGAAPWEAPSAAAPAAAAAADGRSASAMTTGSAGSYYDYDYDAAEASASAGAADEAPRRTMTASSFTASEAVAKALAAGDAAASSTAASQQAEAEAADAEDAEDAAAGAEEGGEEEGAPAGEDQYAYEYAYEYEAEGSAPATADTPAPAAAAAAAAGGQGEVARYLSSRMSVDAFQRREETAVTQRLFAMQRGGVLYKYNQGKGVFGNRSEGTRINPRWAQLNQAQTELQWGDLKTRKLNSSLRLTDVSKIEFGHSSEVFKSFTFKPHDAWLCFSLHSAGRTIDFAAAKESELANWFCGLSGLLQGKPGGGMSQGALMWRILQVKMGEELASQGFGGKIKAYATNITREKALAASGGEGAGSELSPDGPRGVSFVDAT